MKRLLLFLLLIIPALARAQTPITPSWTRQATQIGILDTIGMSYSGQITKQYFGGTAWVRRYMINKADTNTFSATRYWTEHQPHIWYADQTVHGNIILPDANKGIALANSGIGNGPTAMTIDLGDRNGLFIRYHGQTLFTAAGDGYGADDASVRSYVKFAAKPSGISKYYATNDRKFLTGSMDGNGHVTLDTIGYDSLAKKADINYISGTKADSANVYNGSQNIYRNVPNNYIRKISYVLGDSYTVGVGASSTKYNYINRYAEMSGDSIVNNGISSSTLLYYPPYDPAGVLSLDETYTTSIPTYNNSTMNKLFIAYGFNDHRVSYPVDTFKTHYNKIINYAKATKGWPAQSIILISPWYMPPTFYSSLFGQPIPNETQKLAYVSAVQSLANSQGTKYADTYNLIKGGIKRLAMYADSIHENNTAYALIGKYLNGIVTYTIGKNNQKLAVQGLTELSTLKLSPDDTLKTTNYTPIAADSTGRIRKVPNAYILANPADAQGASINLAGDVQSARLYVNQVPPIRGSSVYGAEFNVPVRVNAIYATGGFVAPPGNATSMFVSGGEGYLTSYNADSAKYNTLRINPGNTGTLGSIGQVVIGTGDARFVKSTVKLGISGNLLSTQQLIGSQGFLATGTGTPFGNGLIGQYTGGNGYLYVQGGGAILMQHSSQGGVQIGSSSDIASAMLGVRSTTKGFSPPIMTSTQFGSIASKANGLMAWTTDFATYSVYNSVNVRNIALTNQVLPSNGQIPIGNGTDYTVANITGSATTGLTVTNGAGTIALKNDTTLVRTVANSYSLAGLQTKLNSIFGTLNTWTNQQIFNQQTFFKSGFGIQLYDNANSSYVSFLPPSSVSSPITITLPNKSGTAALTSDIAISGTYTTVATAQTTFTVTIGSTQANNTYKIAVSPGNALSAVNYYITNKTTTTFDIVTIGALTGTVSFDWILSK